MCLQAIPVTKQHGGILDVKLSRDRFRCYYGLFSFWLKLICAIGIPGATGSNMLVLKEALIRAGGFDLSLTCNEDSYLMWQVKRSGYDISFSSRLRVYEFDHRRLDKGRIRKSLHSLIRCAVLFSGMFPDWVRRHDWNYWRTQQFPVHRKCLDANAYRISSQNIQDWPRSSNRPDNNPQLLNAPAEL
jgi:hypothetical protein